MALAQPQPDLLASPPAAEFDPGILDLAAPVVFFPVRHHSPACARLLRALTLRLCPAAVLIEGPSDFNDRLEELFLPHQLPIAIYSYVRLEGGRRGGAFYPFCVYSPEWQALQTARSIGAEVRFIDLPWAALIGAGAPSHRYADAELRFSDYVPTLCQKLGVEDFDSLWDLLAEVDPGLTPELYLERAHRLCHHLRAADRHVPESDLHREAFMAEQIAEVAGRVEGPVLVVTGGFHSHALYRQFYGGVAPGTGGDGAASPESGIALTPYSYERLDSLTGYESGMPNPGFYHQVWEDREAGQGDTFRTLLTAVVKDLRRRKQAVSAADLIAVEATARGLASLRGHEEVWRRDLVDGIIGALVKDELQHGLHHPFLQAVFEVFRGTAHGRLAEGTAVPPLVEDLRRRLREHDLLPTPREKSVELDLSVPEEREQSRLLHRLRGLNIAGFSRIGGTDLAARDDLLRIWEGWRVRWSPEFEASCIEAAIYGTTLEDGSLARFRERAGAAERDAEAAALLLLDSALMGLDPLTAELVGDLVELVRQDGRFLSVARAAGHLLYLYHFDEVLGTSGQRDVAALLVETFSRALWLLETLGTGQGDEAELLKGLRVMLETWERCAARLGLHREEFTGVLRRVSADPTQSPTLRGAGTGALWTLGETDTPQVLENLRYFADPQHLGDFLTGLFALARETVQRHPELVGSIDRVLLEFGDEEFLEALPSLRLAFSYFTPREKHYMARTLLRALGLEEVEPLADLEVTPEMAAQALALEARVFAAVERYGLRGKG